MPQHVDKAFNLTKKGILEFYGYSILGASLGTQIQNATSI